MGKITGKLSLYFMEFAPFFNTIFPQMSAATHYLTNWPSILTKVLNVSSLNYRYA